MKRYLILILFALCSLAAKAQFEGLVHLSYDSRDPHALMDDLNQARLSPSVAFLQRCNMGIGLRNVTERGLLFQMEVDFAVNSVWDSVAAMSGNLFDAFGNTFRYFDNLALTVPVYVGWKFVNKDPFGARLYAGPEFYTRTNFKSFDFKTFSLSAGLGIDLFRTICLDARATYLMASRATSFDQGQMLFSASLGFTF